jgi:hypothetical protein
MLDPVDNAAVGRHSAEARSIDAPQDRAVLVEATLWVSTQRVRPMVVATLKLEVRRQAKLYPTQASGIGQHVGCSFR